MGKHDEEYDFLEDAFRDEPKASTPVHAGDEGTWLDDAFSEQAPVRRKMSGKAKAAIIVAIIAAIIAALVLLVLLGVESMNALGAFLSVAATN